MAKKILIVDDDLYIRDLYAEVLKDENFDVGIAENGEEAIRMLSNDHYDLILLDVMLPKVDGIQVLSQIKDNPETKNTAVIMLTNFGQDDLVKKAVTLGSADYLLKYNITPGEIVTKIKQIIDHKPVTL